MTLNTCIAFPAFRDWKNGPRSIHLTKKIEIEIDHVYEDIFAISSSDATIMLQNAQSKKNLEKRPKTKEYYIDLKDQKYDVYSLDTLIAEIRIKSHDFSTKTISSDSHINVEEAIDIEIFVEYSFE